MLGSDQARRHTRLRRVGSRVTAAVIVSLLVGTGQLLSAAPASALETLGPGAIYTLNGTEASVRSDGSVSVSSLTIVDPIQIPLDGLAYPVTSVEDSGFTHALLNDVDLGTSLRTIGNSAFTENFLTTVRIPATVTSIGTRAFALNDTLTTVEFTGPAPTTFTAAGPTGSLGTGTGLTVYYPVRYASSYVPLLVGYASQAVATVNFDLGGQGDEVPAQSVNTGSTASAPPTPSAAGFVFTGWYTDASLTTPFDFGTPITIDTTVHAGWSIATSTLTFVLNGHGEPISPMTVNTGEQSSGPIAPNDPGWSFNGWYRDAAFATPFEFYGTPITGDLALYALWTEKSFTVSFEMNGHGSPVPDQELTLLEPIAPPATPSEPGWNFIGWYHYADFSHPVTFTDGVSVDTTVFARWHPVEESAVVDGLIYLIDPADPGAGASVVNYRPGPLAIDIPSSVVIDSVTYSVTAIAPDSLANFGLTAVTLPSSLATIGVSSFVGNKLTTIEIPDSVTTIGGGAFGWNDLTAVSLPQGLTMIDEFAFGYNLLLAVTIPDSVTAVQRGAFAGNRLISIDLGTSVETIGSSAFYFNSLTRVTIPPSVTSIEGDAFGLNIDANYRDFLDGYYSVADTPDPLTTPSTLTGVDFLGAPPTTFVDAPLTAGDDPTVRSSLGSELGLTVHFTPEFADAPGNPGFTLPTWRGYATQGTLTVSFDLGGRGGALAPEFVMPGQTVTPPTPPTAMGWTFDGWFGDAGLTSPFSFSTPLTVDTTLYAGWTINSYTVDFDLRGHGVAIGSQQVPFEDFAIEPTPPSASGWMFSGWFTDAGLSSPFLFGTPITTDTTLYAGWALPPVILTFDMNGYGAPIAPVTVDPGAPILEPTDPSANGMTFTGWFLEAAAQEPLVFREGLTESTTVFAGWRSQTDSSIGSSGLVFAIDPAHPEAGASVIGYRSGTPALIIPAAAVIDSVSYPVTSIGSFGLSGRGLTSVTLPSSLTSMGDYALYRNSLTAAELADHVTSIGEAAYANNRLAALRLPAGLTEISAFAFAYNPLTEVTIPNTVMSIGNGAFVGSALSSLTLGSSVTSIGASAFLWNSLTSVTIPASVTSIGGDAFGRSFGLDYDDYSEAGIWPNAANTPSLLTRVEFLGAPPANFVDAPFVSDDVPNEDQPSFGHEASLTVYFPMEFADAPAAPGFTAPTWRGYTTRPFATLSFAMGGRGEQIAPQRLAPGEVAAEPVSPISAGYTFTGWYADASLTTPFNFTSAVQTSAVAHASWSVNTSIVAFEMNGRGTGFVPLVVTPGTVVAEPAPPTDPCWRFVGWYADAELTTPFNFETGIFVNTTIYASWAVATVTLSFEMNGHGDAVKEQIVPAGQQALPPIDPIDQIDRHLIFTGWYTDAALTTLLDFTSALTTSATAYAGWEELIGPRLIIVTIEMGGHGVNTSYLSSAGQPLYRPEPPVSPGYTFTNWFMDPALSIPFPEDLEGVGDISMYAGWSENPRVGTADTVALTLDLGDRGTNSALRVQVGDIIIPPAPPTASGFIFIGWFADAELTIPFEFNIPVTAATTLHAGWKAGTLPPPSPGVPADPGGSTSPGSANGPGSSVGGLASTGTDGSGALLAALAALTLGGLLLARRRQA